MRFALSELRCAISIQARPGTSYSRKPHWVIALEYLVLLDMIRPVAAEFVERQCNRRFHQTIYFQSPLFAVYARWTGVDVNAVVSFERCVLGPRPGRGRDGGIGIGQRISRRPAIARC
jgi:hypothetical protein